MQWLVYYSDKAPAEAFDGYGLLVFDSLNHPPLGPFSGSGKTLLGYISLCEVREGRSYFEDVRADGVLLHENANWKGSHLLDIRNPLWRRRVVEQLIPEILARGFDGLFIDTLDNAVYLENADPEKYEGMKASAVELVREIRRRYPSTKIMVNRAYELLPAIEQHIDIVLGESMFTSYDFRKGVYSLAARNIYQKQADLLKAARERRPGLKLLSLDYWDPDDVEGVARIYRSQRANGFRPYVATIALDRIVEEPK